MAVSCLAEPAAPSVTHQTWAAKGVYSDLLHAIEDEENGSGR